MKSFVHIHAHSSYSVLDGMSSIENLVDKAIADGMPALALTDHGNMFGIKEFYNYSKKKNAKHFEKIKKLNQSLENAVDEAEKKQIQDEIVAVEKNIFKPIFGCEVYVAKRSRFMKEDREDRSGYHLVLLAKNKKGYQNLSRMVSLGHIEGFYYRPRIDRELLERYSEGIIASSACLGGEIHKKIEVGDLEGAENAIMWHKKVFGEDYYIELQRHETDKLRASTDTFEKQELQNAELIKLARKTNTKIIASNDVHFVEEEHADAHEHLICLSTGKDLDDPTRMRYTKQEWLKSPAEMHQIFEDIPEAIDNTIELASKVEIYDLDGPPLMPKFDIPTDFGILDDYRKRFDEKALIDEFGIENYTRLGGYDDVLRVKLESDYLEKLTYIGAEKRYGNELSEEVKERIDFELDTMKTMGYPGYFLIVQDFIQAARDMGVSVGPGRGSAAGSVVAYCLKITNVDPLKYDLLFERFLNPDRVSLPDIDIDFEDDRRGEVVQWVTEKYGKERVASIVTYGTMGTKSAIKDVARVQRLPLPEADRLTKLIPNRIPKKNENDKDIKVTVGTSVQYVEELKEARNSSNPTLSNTLKYAEMLEGTVRQTGVHACGLIIGSDDLINLVPLSTAVDKDTKEDKIITQFEGTVIEDIGLIKMDFLGLKTLSIIKEALNNIKKSKGIDIDIDSIAINDKKTYKLFSKGNTVAVFQFESAGMQKYLKELKPTQFEDLIAMNALYRPGPMDYIPQFVKRKHGEEQIDYPLDVMKNRLEETYGITVYQEQVMLLSRDLAGFTRGESDELRKAMGKKQKDKMESLHAKFIEGAQNNGYGPISTLEKIWSDWAKFASYAFNKSHATCYSLIAYQTAYLKAHYPAEFMAANLTRNKDDISEVGKLMDDCRTMKIHVLGPDINESDLNFTVNKEGNIRFGLGGIKNVGQAAVESIVEERNKNGKFTGIFDFIERVNLQSCNKKNIESLAYAGAFDAFEDIKREQFFAINSKEEPVLESLIKYGNLFQEDKQFNQNSLFGTLDDAIEISKPEIPFTNDWSSLIKLNYEREMIGMYLSAHPMDEYKFELNHLCNATTTDAISFKSKPLGTGLKMGGIVTAFRNGTTRNGKPYGMITIEDYDGAYEFPLFGKDYETYSKYMIKDIFIYVHAVVQERQYGWNRSDDNEKPEIELKLISIIPFKDARKQIKSLRISLYSQNVDSMLLEKLLDYLSSKKGDVNLFINLVDIYTAEKLTLYSRKHQIKITTEIYNWLNQAQEEGLLRFEVEKRQK